MTLSPIGFALIGLILAFSRLSKTRIIALGGATLPFGFFAVIQVGGFSLIFADFFFMTVVAIYLTLALVNGSYRRMPRAFLIPMIFAIYGTIWAFFPARFFAGDIYVFPLVGEIGQQVSNAFRSTISPVAPSQANISQLVYFLWFIAAFLFFRSFSEREGARPLVQLLMSAAIANFFLCFLNLINADPVLSLFQTADYSSLTGAKIHSITRITGGFPEASRLGDFVVPLGSLFTTLYFLNGGKVNLTLGATSFLIGLMTLSSTAFIGIAAFAAIIMFHIFKEKQRSSWQRFSLLCASLALVLVVLVISGGFLDTAESMVNSLLIDKVGSQSGLERGAWALQGFIAFWESYGLGVGLGSARSNGLLPVLLSNLGLVGLGLFVMMVAPAFKYAGSAPVQKAALVAFLVALSMKMASQTTMTLGIPFALYLALAMKPRRT